MTYVKEAILGFGVLQLFLELPKSVEIFIVTAILYVLLSVLELAREKMDAQEGYVELKEALVSHRAMIKAQGENLRDLRTIVEGLEKGQELTRKLAEDSKKLMSEANIGMGFRAVKRN